MAKKVLLLYLDNLEVLDAMDNEQAGMFFKALKAYQSGDDVEPFLTDQVVKVVFMQINRGSEVNPVIAKIHENYGFIIFKSLKILKIIQ